MVKYVTLGLVILLLPLGAVFGSEVLFDGFLQTLHGARLDEDNPTATEMTASETRLQMRLEHFGDIGEFFGRLDFLYDGADSGVYEWELREGFFMFRVGNNFDFKVGRQILTWGTGDLIFINDVFAKDYRSFFVGRDDQYLKSPQNALRADYYFGPASLSLVWSPRFEPNRLPTGQRLSYFNGEEIVGEGFSFQPTIPEPKFENGEFAVRTSRTLGSFNVSLYFYKGFYKNPVGVTMMIIDSIPSPVPIFPKLNLYGTSVRGALFGGIVWLEGGYWDSREDQSGDNPLMLNSQMTGLIGYERQVAANLTVNAQWQVEYMLDHDAYQAQNRASGLFVRDEYRHLLTTRVTKLLVDELLTLSGFTFYSPTDEDVYVRFSAAYKLSDEINLTVGGNIFDGNHQATEFGQLRMNDNIYLKAAYGF